MKKVTLIVTLFIVTISCTEPYALQSNTFEDILVIEATITNELKKQEIKISRTFQLEEKEPQIEKNATVFITDNLGNQYNFNEINDKYISEFEFQAMSERQYQLFVNTSNGKQYTSTREKLTTENNLTSIEASVKNKFGVRGVDITANSFDPTNSSKYYRYEYEETYRFTVPFWAPDSLQIFGNAEYDDPSKGKIKYALTQHQRNGASKTCFKTDKNNQIILSNTTSLIEDRIKDESIRFISYNNFIIADRYTILIKQYIQNLASHTYYKTLKKLSETDNVLSPNQPGFINGNLSAVENKNEKVIGFFDVSTVSEKRIFFNYQDIFPEELEPPYFYKCDILDYDSKLLKDPALSITPPFGLTNLVITSRQGNLILYERIANIYRMVPPECGDCRSIGSNIPPIFWQ
ncbi:DUF4249 domain-containing protein [uncultured Flavobacterium sp.]|uniref:DUF4249 domain-containing protein n=1 Tax=uncultured Flavobacterium sp. TaxID=165435 RepID=UPI0030ECA4D9|tara:strand:+ start:93451 stop:94668 length:1218 start_codon:yes stop_codon:yes gene_type:complete